MIKRHGVHQTAFWLLIFTAASVWTARELPAQQLASFSCDDHVWDIAFRPDGKVVVAAMRTGHLRFWDVTSKTETLGFRAHRSEISMVAWSERATLATSSYDNTICLWDVTGKLLTTLKSDADGYYAMCWLPGGKRIAACTQDKVIEIWDVPSVSKVETLRGHTGYVGHVAVSPDGKTLASSSADQTIRIWDLQSGKTKSILRGEEKEHPGPLAFVSNGELVTGGFIFSGELPGRIRFWNVRRAAITRTIVAHQRGAADLELSPNGKLLASCGRDGLVHLWDFTGSKPVATLDGHKKRYVTGVAFSSDGTVLASCGYDGTVKLWRVPKVNP